MDFITSERGSRRCQDADARHVTRRHFVALVLFGNWPRPAQTNTAPPPQSEFDPRSYRLLSFHVHRRDRREIRCTLNTKGMGELPAELEQVGTDYLYLRDEGYQNEGRCVHTRDDLSTTPKTSQRREFFIKG